MMKQTPETRPNREILERFIAWTKILDRPVEECLEDYLEVYKTYDQSDYPTEQINLEDWKTFIFEIDLEKWERFKRWAKDSYGHSRDMALSIAMKYFVDVYDAKLSEVL